MKSFFSLIDRMNHDPDQSDMMERVIWDTFGADRAVMALDMSGFSLTVRREGILAYLRQIRRMQEAALPLVRRHHGDVVKCDADNLMLVFASCDDAATAAVAIRDACAVIGIQVSIGLDFGRVLLVPETDCYGDAVNLAYKLGEDIARAGEILMTGGFRQRLAQPSTGEAQSFSVSGLTLECWRL